MHLLQAKEQQLRQMLSFFSNRIDTLEWELAKVNGDYGREVLIESSIAINEELIIKIACLISGQTISRKQ